MHARPARYIAPLLALFVITLPGNRAAAEIVTGGAIYIMGGAVQIQDTKQTFSNLSRASINVDVDATSTSTFNVGWEIRLRHGWAVGTEYLRYDNRFTQLSNNARGTATTRSLMVTGKKYFLTEGHFHPYIGAGIGTVETEVNNTSTGGTVDDYNHHLLGHALVGVEWRLQHLSVLLEARTLFYDVDHNKADYNPGGNSVLFGLGYNW